MDSKRPYSLVIYTALVLYRMVQLCRPYSLVIYTALVVYRMVQLCRPYGEGITCLCDEKDHVLKCFLETSNPTPQVLISL